MPIPSRIVLGLNSGTSADGVDAVACEIRGRGLRMRPTVLGHVQESYPAALRRRILAVMAPAETRTEDLCRLESEIGHVFADAALKAVRNLGLRRVDLIGSHGQTVCHLPPGRNTSTRATGTLQLGDPAIIAVRTGVPVVARFRQADMAAGGQGAPLVPWTDLLLLGDQHRGRMIQNIGGIANLTWLPPGGRPEDVVAFDTGPGNMVMDALVRSQSRGRRHYDRDGRLAARGRVDERVLDDMLRNPYFAKPAPKSCGREQFGESWTADLLKRHASRRLSPADWLATAAMLTACSIAKAYSRVLHQRPGQGRRTPRLDEVILCGGGAFNPTLRGMMRDCLIDQGLEQARLETIDAFGIPSQAKEGLSFALLAATCVDRVPANLPQVTRARRAVVLGQICDPTVRK